jgi:hypothetical protein
MPLLPTNSLVKAGPLAEQALIGGKIPFSAVARMVGFGLGTPKFLYFSMGVD